MSVTTSSSGGDGYVTAVTSATSTPTLDAASGNNNSDPRALSTGAKAGIGVGAAALGLAALGLVLWFSTWYRRERTQKREGDGQGQRQGEASSFHAVATDQNGHAISPQLQQPTTGYYYYPSEAGSTTGSVPPCYNSTAWPGYSGFKSELPADSERGFRSELPGEDLVTHTEPAIDTERERSPSPATTTAQPQAPSEPGSPAHYLSAGTLTSVSDVSSILTGSPPTQSGQLHREASPGSDVDEHRTQMTPISEVHEEDVEGRDAPFKGLN